MISVAFSSKGAFYYTQQTLILIITHPKQNIKNFKSQRIITEKLQFRYLFHYLAIIQLDDVYLLTHTFHSP